ncbi:hypothetical protein Y032_0023g675 [Ancylostoma ceylanicum]|uniref:Uncharacterized protein n=1 Tax=Ancylostoma ceylanicum TaxID=53326 RepID=A0A016UZ09_9BILA|nr:hypothetical protein Y032_0023g675 [Ancylostoma ceylanicum]
MFEYSKIRGFRKIRKFGGFTKFENSNFRRIGCSKNSKVSESCCVAQLLMECDVTATQQHCGWVAWWLRGDHAKHVGLRS